jgi:hypothetical protein
MPRAPPLDNARSTALTVVPVAGVLVATCFLRAARTYDRDAGAWHQLPDVSRGQDGGEALR